MYRRILLLAITILVISQQSFGGSTSDSRLTGSFRNAAKNGWTFVHLEGKPSVIGFQHGYLLSEEIEDNKRAIELSTTHAESVSWAELRKTAVKLFLPKVTGEYREELQGIVDGLAAHRSKLDLTDLVTMNAFMEFSYYFDQVRREKKLASHEPAEHCSAFIATGSYSKDGKIVIGHNNWTDYLTGTRWNIVFDVTPESGQRFIMDGMPGLIHSGDDFGVNAAGILITETTIGNFHGFSSEGVPEFIRARRAMQYAKSIDDFARYMKEGNNGAYANTWLIGDTKTNEIGRLELGLKNVTLDKLTDGYFVGANFPINQKLISEETTFPMSNPETPNLIRRRRWDQLMAENKGKIDVAMAQKFETDHYDALTKEIDPNERTLCGHIDRSSRGMPGWQGPHSPAGVAEVKVADSTMAKQLSFLAGLGHPCGVEFKADEHLKRYPDFAWQKKLLHDVNANPWTTVESLRKPAR